MKTRIYATPAVKGFKTEILLYKPLRPKGFFQFDINDLARALFPFHLNTYVMGLYTAIINTWLFQCGDRL